MVLAALSRIFASATSINMEHVYGWGNPGPIGIMTSAYEILGSPRPDQPSRNVKNLWLYTTWAITCRIRAVDGDVETQAGRPRPGGGQVREVKLPFCDGTCPQLWTR